MRKRELIMRILEASQTGGLEFTQGILEFCRGWFCDGETTAATMCTYLRPRFVGSIAQDSDRQPVLPKTASAIALLRVHSVNIDPKAVNRPQFDDLTPIYPEERLRLGWPSSRTWPHG